MRWVDEGRRECIAVPIKSVGVFPLYVAHAGWLSMCEPVHSLYLALPVFLLRSLRLFLSAPPFVLFPLELSLRLWKK